jgi:hypothetical protein
MSILGSGYTRPCRVVDISEQTYNQSTSTSTYTFVRSLPKSDVYVYRREGSVGMSNDYLWACVCTRTGKELDIAAKLLNQVHIDTVWVVQCCQLAAWSSRQILIAWIWHVRWFRFNQLSTIVGTSILQSLRKPRITHFQFITSSRLPSLQSIVLNITLPNKNHAVATQPNPTPNPP